MILKVTTQTQYPILHHTKKVHKIKEFSNKNKSQFTHAITINLGAIRTYEQLTKSKTESW